MKSAVSVNKIGVLTRGRKPRKIGVVSPPGHFGPVQLNVKHGSRVIDPLTIEHPFVGPPWPPTAAQLFPLEETIDAEIDLFRDRLESHKPSITHAAVLRGWARNFRISVKRFLQVEPLIRYKRGHINVDSQTKRRRGTDVAVNLFQEAADYLESLSPAGRTTKNYYETQCVYQICRAYFRHTGAPHYKDVTKRMFEEFAEELFENKEPIDKQKRDWAKDRYERWEQLLKDPKAMARQKRAREQREIL